MSILFLLIPLSLILLCVAIWAFFWAVDSNQFDDLSGPAYSILYDDDLKTGKTPAQTAQNSETPETGDNAAIADNNPAQISDSQDNRQA